MFARRIGAVLLALPALASDSARALGILERRCLSCHNAAAKTAGLDLSTRDSARRVLDGLLLRRVSDGQMPPSGKLPGDEISALRAWMEAGAPWEGRLELKRAGPDWWSFQPIHVRPAPDAPAEWAGSAIDRWIFAALRDNGLSPAPPANRQVLIRRLSFDLTGLPPSPEEIAAFVADTRPGAYEHLVDRLLASPHYGERWARHWLDVARFAESEGFERDWMRDNAWPYRDYVIRSLNEDKPYTVFAREQIAGDVLPKDQVTRDGIVATGFLVSGPTDEVGLTSAVAEQREMVREDQLEEMVGTVAQTFLGLTVNCARCHDHKFDPIPQRDYYALKANLQGVWQGERPLLTPAEQEEREARLGPPRTRIADLESKIAAAEESVREGRRPQQMPIAQWTFDSGTRDRIGPLHMTLPKGAKLEEGRLRGAVSAKTVTLHRDLREKTLEVWLTVTGKIDKAQTVLQIANQSGYRGAAVDAIQFTGGTKRQWQNQSTASFRTQDVNQGPEETAAGSRIHMAIAYAADDTIRIYRNGVPYGAPYKPDTTTPAGKLQTYVRGDAEVSVTSSAALEVDEARVYDRALTAEQVAASFATGAQSVTVSGVEVSAWREQLDAARRQLTEAGEPAQIFAVDSKAPGVVHLLERGDVNRKRAPVTPAGLSAVRGLTPDFGIAVDAPDAERRRKLAEWIVDARNPLFARVMVNRVWQHHFGAGLVSSPSDFGYNGGKPSHPELLDSLAAEFAANGWSLKKLHKSIVMSAAYRQSSRLNPAAAAKDAENRLLWRFSPRRLEGEAVRDAMLAASGELNPRMGGPSFKPFTSEKKGSLEVYTLVDKPGPEFDRRTVYRMNVNSAPSPMLEGLDCPVPSVKTPKRAATTTPLQALSLMNGAFVNRQAAAFAKRLERESADVRIDRAFQLALGRGPDADERAWSTDLATRGGWPALAWGLFNLSEFVYVE